METGYSGVVGLPEVGAVSTKVNTTTQDPE